MGREARANQPTATDEIGPWLFSLPIAKVDKDQRLVSGIVTSEILDKQGDIVDYESAKKVFTDEALWPGNMREMHQPKAVGKRYSVAFDDVTKEITLTAKVSKGAPDTWEKVLDGTLSMYSIGGSGKRVAEKTADGGTAKRLHLDSLAEVSFVDNGACPTAKFEVVKSVDGKLTDLQPAEPEDIQNPVEKAAAAVDAALAAATPVPVAYVAGSIRKLVGDLARATDRVARKATVIAEAEAAGAEAVAELPLSWQPEAVRKGSPEPYDIDRALGIISGLEWLLSSEYYDVIYGQVTGGTPDPVKVAQVAAIKTAIDAVLQFVISEHQEQFSADANGMGGLDLELDTVVEMFVKSLDVVQKAGARHSKKDQEMVQKVHDTANALGAACTTDGLEKAAKAATCKTCSDTKKIRGGNVDCPDCGAAKVAAVAPVVVVSEPIEKLTADLEAAKAALSESQATVAKQAETVTALDARMKLLEDAPAGGGPVRNAQAVDKALGGPADGTETATPDSVIKALQAVAEESKEPAVKAAIAMQIVKLSHHTQIALSPR